MASRSHELRQAEKLRTCEDVLDRIRAAALAGLDQWWAGDLQTTIQQILRLAEEGLDGKRVLRVAPPLSPSAGDTHSPLSEERQEP